MKESMFGDMAVKHIAVAEKNSPTRKDRGRIARKNGVWTSPKAAMTASTIDELMRLFVAPHKISPVITSSRLTGVAIMASNVF